MESLFLWALMGGLLERMVKRCHMEPTGSPWGQERDGQHQMEGLDRMEDWKARTGKHCLWTRQEGRSGLAGYGCPWMLSAAEGCSGLQGLRYRLTREGDCLTGRGKR